MKKLFITLLISTFLSLNICLAWADTESDISAQEVASIIKEYETAYMNRDLDKMIQYVDRDSKWFKGGFLEEFKAVFKNFTNINLYHFDKKGAYYIADGVEFVQNTLYVAYSSSLTDINEITENYYLKKVDGKYKISECIHFPARDIELVDKGVGALLKNNIDQAISCFKEASNLNPKNSAAHFRLGMAYLHLKKAQDALYELQKAAELRPYVGFYRLYLFHVYRQLGENEKAIEELSKAISLDPGIEATLVKKE
jgi:tetratricopeptide (TPR) repeat protein